MHHLDQDNQMTKADILKLYGREPETLEQLAECVISVINSQYNSGFGKLKKANKYKVIGFHWIINSCISIHRSQRSPDELLVNEESDSSGWTGRVWIRYAEECNGFGSDPFKHTRTYPGTGGFGSYNGPWADISTAHWQAINDEKTLGQYPQPVCYSWDYRIYNADWPAIAAWVECEKICAKLKGENWGYSHQFMWDDKETLDADKEFMSFVNRDR